MNDSGFSTTTGLDDPKGDIFISLPLGPVRFKAPRERKQTLTSMIKEHTAKETFLLTGEVKVEIEWMIHEQDRYESLQGPEGVIINDWQVRDISCRWIDCRNVLIYFDSESKRKVVNNLAKCLSDDGLLLIGHAENLNGLTRSVRSLRPTIHCKAESYDRLADEFQARRPRRK